MALEQYANEAETELAADVDSGEFEIAVVSANGFPEEPQFRIRVDDELMCVHTVNGTTWGVSRDIEVTGIGLGVPHAAGAKVTHVLTAGGLLNLNPSQQTSGDADDGQVPTADGLGGIAWQNPPSGNGIPYLGDALLHLPFDGSVPYEHAFDVSLVGHRGQTPTVATGGIIGRPGKFGKAVQIAEATTNYVTNPTCEVDTAGWSVSSSDGSATMWRSATHYWIGSASLGVNPYTSTWHFARYPTNEQLQLADGESCTLSAWVYRYGGTPELRIYTGSTLRASAAAGSIPLYTWTRVSVTWTNNTGSAIWVHCRLVGGAAVNTYFDGIQLEAKAYPTPLCHGNMGPGHTWTGTPHASTSTRTLARLTYPHQMETGSLSVWLSETWLSDGFTSSPRVVDANITNGLIAYYNRVSRGIVVSVAGYSVEAVPATPWAPWEWVHLAATWDSAVLRIYINGELAATDTTGYAGLVRSSTLSVGNRSDGLRPWNGYLDDLLILDRALSAEEVHALYSMNRPAVILDQAGEQTVTSAGVRRVADQSIPSHSGTRVLFDTLSWDDRPSYLSAQWDVGVPGLLTCRVPGKYIMTARGSFAANASGVRELTIRIPTPVVVVNDRRSAASTGTTDMSVTAVRNFAVGDQIETRAYQTSGADLNISAVSLEWVRLGS